MKKTTKHQAVQPKPRTRIADPGAEALRRIIMILRPLPVEKRAQVLRSVLSYYPEGSSGS